MSLLQAVPPLCDFEQWIDLEIPEVHRRVLEGTKQMEAEFKARWEMEQKEKAAREERRQEEQRRIAAVEREERERKLERARRAKAALEENPDALRKGKWPRCTQ